MKRRWLVLPLLLLLLGGGAAALLLERRGALAVLLTFQEAVPADLEAGAAPPPGLEWVEDPARHGVARLWRARPDDPDGAPVLVLVVGVGRHGIRDGRVLRAVEAFRRGGCEVLAPELPMLVTPARPDDDLARLGRLLDVAFERAAGAPRPRVLLAGVSVGASLLLRALIERLEGGGSPPRAWLGIGVPYDVEAASAAWFEAPAGPAALDPEAVDAAAFARAVLWRAGLSRRVADAGDRSRLAAWLDEVWRPVEAPDGLVSPAGRAFAQEVLAGPAVWRERHPEVLDAATDALDLLSPARWSERLARLAPVRCFLLHGETDPQFPVAQGERLAAALAPHAPTVLLRSRVLGHTAVGRPGLGEAWEHVCFIDDFLDAADE